MVLQIILAAALLAALFIIFLVISKSTGMIDNSLYKLEYMIRRECDIRLEGLESKYRLRAANKKFDELYGKKHFEEDLQKATDSNE